MSWSRTFVGAFVSRKREIHCLRVEQVGQIVSNLLPGSLGLAYGVSYSPSPLVGMFRERGRKAKKSQYYFFISGRGSYWSRPFSPNISYQGGLSSPSLMDKDGVNGLLPLSVPARIKWVISCKSLTLLNTNFSYCVSSFLLHAPHRWTSAHLPMLLAGIPQGHSGLTIKTLSEHILFGFFPLPLLFPSQFLCP